MGRFGGTLAIIFVFAEKCTRHRCNIFPSVYPSDPIIPHSLVLSQSPRNFWSGELFSRDFYYFDRSVTLELQQSALRVTCIFFQSQWHGTLESLDISSNRGVDDECMELLSNFEMPKLQSLDLNNTNITSDGVR